MDNEQETTAPAEPTPAPIQITPQQIVDSILNLNSRVLRLEEIYSASLKQRKPWLVTR
jgi:hypothetical protein